MIKFQFKYSLLIMSILCLAVKLTEFLIKNYPFIFYKIIIHIFLGVKITKFCPNNYIFLII